LGQDGLLYLFGPDNQRLSRAPLFPTQWNRDNSKKYHRLYANVPWGIVLHWYGDREDFDRTVKGYLRGFDSLRAIDDFEVRTSAHFLVGDSAPALDAGLAVNGSDDRIGVLQTQAPDTDGVPFLASHLQPIDLVAHLAKQQYFVRAVYQLAYADPAVHSLLQDLFDGPYLDANMRTIAIEIAGYDFENPAHFPSPQKIANVLGLVWALMRRYRIPASGLLGHNEVQLNKADPGKKFIALMRYLLGLKALLDGDGLMLRLVFGQYLPPGGDPHEAVRRYFRFTRDFLAIVSAPRRVFEWEAQSRYWLAFDALFPGPAPLRLVSGFLPPAAGALASLGRVFLDPNNHEGVDLYRDPHAARSALPLESARLSAGGLCLSAGPVRGCTGGNQVIFLHHLPDGAQILSVYSHLAELGDYRVGDLLPAGAHLGWLPAVLVRGRGEFLHFALAYGATWDTQLSRSPEVPLNAGPNWIRDRYLQPLAALSAWPASSPPSNLDPPAQSPG
jgi:hypothetical protein